MMEETELFSRYFESIFYCKKFDESYFENEIATYTFPAMELRFSCQLETFDKLCICLYSQKHGICWQRDTIESSNQRCARIVIHDLNNDDVVKFHLSKVCDGMLIEKLSGHYKLWDIFNSTSTRITIQLANKYRSREFYLEIACVDCPKYECLHNEMLVRVEFSQLRVLQLHRSPMALEFFCGDDLQDANFVGTTSYFIANNSCCYSIDEFLMFQCKLGSILYIYIRPFNAESCSYKTQIRIETVSPFQPNEIALTIEKYDCMNSIYGSFSTLSLDTLDPRSIITLKLYYEYQVISKWTLERFLQYPSDEFYLSISRAAVKMTEIPEFITVETVARSFEHWISHADFDFSLLQKIYSAKFVSRLLGALPVSKLQQVLNTFSLDSLANLYIDGNLSPVDATSFVLKIMEMTDNRILILLDFVYSTLNMEQRMFIEAQLLERPILFDYYSEQLPFTEEMKKQRVIEFLPNSNIANWLRLNFLSNSKKVASLVNTNYATTEEIRFRSGLLKSTTAQLQFTATLNEFDNAIQEHNYYVMRFDGSGFPIALKTISFIYQSIDILATTIEQLQVAFPDALIKPYCSYDNSYQCVHISTVEQFTEHSFELFSCEQSQKIIFQIDAIKLDNSRVNPVIKETTIDFPPVEQAIQSLEDKIKKLKGICIELSLSFNHSRIDYEQPLLMIQGCLHAPINGGISQYKDLIKHERTNGRVAYLSKVIEEYESILHQAIQTLPIDIKALLTN